ncbi:MAG: nitroreductase [Hyphomicrobiaceae bacterium]|nr:nitroreductase [Hyphomicrobiaceae bacterium]
MAGNQAMLDYLLTRRSVTLPFLAEPGPSAAELKTLLTIATRVPDHAKLTPWRLVVYSGEDRAAIGAELARRAAERNPAISEEMLEKERNQFLPAPLTVGVLSKPVENPKAPEMEQLLSAGCVAFNLLNGAFALGYAAHWVTRWFAFDKEAATFLGAEEGEQFVGFIHIGTPTAHLGERDRPELEEVVRYWTPPAH